MNRWGILRHASKSLDLGAISRLMRVLELHAPIKKYTHQSKKYTHQSKSLRYCVLNGPITALRPYWLIIQLFVFNKIQKSSKSCLSDNLPLLIDACTRNTRTDPKETRTNPKPSPNCVLSDLITALCSQSIGRNKTLLSVEILIMARK